ncbi:MAG: phospholipase D-like domain-containing protein, partial [Pseudomonadota bacterium]|nr:phospholipase D-like domain-containing protein [Pseudomonadota bacterium]
MEHVTSWLLGARIDVELVLGLFLAVCVTVHALLRKRDVASAAGWIGLSWFAPFFGSGLYFLMGINRVQRRAQHHRPRRRRQFRAPTASWDRNGDGRIDEADLVEPAMAPLQLGVGRITARPLVPGNTIEIYADGDEAYPPMLAAIAAATQSVGLSSYIFRNDEWGGRFIEALRAATERGVAVRVLIDGVGGGYFLGAAYHRLRRAGVVSARFLHSVLPWRMPFVNLRSHKKILVVDGVIGFTGGMNIADENVMATRPTQPVQDTHFRFEGPIVGQLVEDFLQDWAFATEEMLDGPAWFAEELDLGNGFAARAVDAGPDKETEKVEFTILQAIACAQTSIEVMTPYFLPDDRLITALSLAAMRGVGVDIVIPERSDHRFVDWATRPNIGPLLQDGARVWLSPPPFRHSKLMVVDGAWCLIGSSNWDMRSFRLNFELCVECYDPALGRALSEK